MKIPEVTAREILTTYEGANNQLLEWKSRLDEKGFKLTRTQADYILKYHELKPKIARKYVNIVENFGEDIMTQRHMMLPPANLWVEKILCDTDKAYHIWGKFYEKDKLQSIWIPKIAIVQEEKKLNRVIDYSKYDVRPLMNHQKTAVEKLLANDRYILADDMGLGKFLPNKTPIYTPTGIKKIGDIKIGDKVIGSNGKECNVIGVFPQGIKETYKITFNDGYSILCGKEHLWKVSSLNYGKNTNNNRIKKDLVLSTDQLMDKSGKITIKGNGYNEKRKYTLNTYYLYSNGNSKWQIPIVKPIQFENNYLLPIDSYLLGLGLGDRFFKRKNIRFSLNKDDYDKSSENGYINVNNSLFDLLLEDKRSHTKFIPDIYKYSSIENRLSILQGLMDTDGHYIKSKDGFFNGTQYTTVSEKLCDDVAEIVHSLGGICRKRSRIEFYKKNGIRKERKTVYYLNIKLRYDMNPFRLKRKSNEYDTPKKYKTGRYIKNIEKYGEDECTCISVDSPDKLYVAEHAIVTHNTTSAIVSSLESGAKKILIVCPASLKINWKREIETYTNKKIFIIEGKKWGSTFDYYIINYDILKNYHTTEEGDNESNNFIENTKFDLAIIDEAHFISNSSAKRTELLMDILENIPKVWLLTGTPMTSRPINYYNLLKIVNSPLTLSWKGYVRRYCRGYQITKSDGKKTWITSGASNLDELRERTKNVVLRRMKTDILDLPEKIISPLFLELTNTFYNEEIEDFLKITKESKEKESITITLNRLMGIRKLIAVEKIPYTCELIDKFIEQDKKVIVLTNFTVPIDILYEKYKKIAVVVDGRVYSKEKRQKNVDLFQNDPKIKLFIGNLKAAGVGLNLTAAEAVIMNDLSFVPSDHNQGEDRAYRHGQQKCVNIYYPIFDNTIERIVYNILNKKKNIIDQVLGDGEYSESFSKELLKELF